MWLQKKIQLSPKSRGFHLITDEITSQFPEMRMVKVGIAHFLLQHTSASLSINENADISVRRDMESHLNELAPENAPYYEHTYEGPDDMPAHIRTALTQTNLSIPIKNNKIILGQWQGIFIFEHRFNDFKRKVHMHLIGE